MTYYTRIKKLQNLMKELSCDALVVDDLIDIYYLSGQDISAGKLVVHMQGAHLLVDKRYSELCKKAGPFPVIEDANANYDLIFTHPELSSIKKLAFNSEKTFFKDYQNLHRSIERCFAETSRKIDLIPAESLVKKLRSIKDEQEGAVLQESAKLCAYGFDFICSLLKEGITEEEVAIELEIFWKLRGGRAVSFDPIIAFGTNGSMPHYRAGKTRLKSGQAVLVDLGVKYQHYHSDMTRMIFFGQPEPEIQTIHAVVQQAQRKALDCCRPGTFIGELDTAARDFITSHGYGKNFTHSLGHGIGLEIHEFPVIRNVSPFKDIALAPGMVITIEPGIYLPGIGGVRIEDTVLITETGYLNLTNRTTDPMML